jgi:hypothetical protein
MSQLEKMRGLPYFKSFEFGFGNMRDMLEAQKEMMRRFGQTNVAEQDARRDDDDAEQRRAEALRRLEAIGTKTMEDDRVREPDAHETAGDEGE